MKIRIGVLLLLVFFLNGCSAPDRAGVEILATPVAKVYINGKEAGSTPYKNKSLTAGMVTVKLVWGSEGQTTWQQDLRLSPFTDTVVDLNMKKGLVSGYMLSLEANKKPDKSGLILATYPDGALAGIDGTTYGTSPLRIDSLEDGDKHIRLTSPGYKDLDIYAKLIKGYVLSVFGFLAREDTVNEPTIVQPEKTTTMEKALVLKNQAGFLRVRREANTNSEEIKKSKTRRKLRSSFKSRRLGSN
jgi:hypothetical protein